MSTIRRVLRQEFLINRDVLGALVDQVAGQIPRAQPGTSAERLTPREAMVLRLLARGRTNREIATRLRVSAGTIKVHVERIIGKLGAADRTDAAVRAMELGLLASRQG